MQIQPRSSSAQRSAAAADLTKVQELEAVRDAANSSSSGARFPMSCARSRTVRAVLAYLAPATHCRELQSGAAIKALAAKISAYCSTATAGEEPAGVTAEQLVHWGVPRGNRSMQLRLLAMLKDLRQREMQAARKHLIPGLLTAVLHQQREQVQAAATSNAHSDDSETEAGFSTTGDAYPAALARALELTKASRNSEDLSVQAEIRALLDAARAAARAGGHSTAVDGKGVRSSRSASGGSNSEEDGADVDAEVDAAEVSSLTVSCAGFV